MNTKFKLVRLVVAATFGSLLWAGCASERTYLVDTTAKTQPVDLVHRNVVATHLESKIDLVQHADLGAFIEPPVFE